MRREARKAAEDEAEDDDIKDEEDTEAARSLLFAKEAKTKQQSDLIAQREAELKKANENAERARLDTEAKKLEDRRLAEVARTALAASKTAEAEAASVRKAEEAGKTELIEEARKAREFKQTLAEAEIRRGEEAKRIDEAKKA